MARIKFSSCYLSPNISPFIRVFEHIRISQMSVLNFLQVFQFIVTMVHIPSDSITPSDSMRTILSLHHVLCIIRMLDYLLSSVFHIRDTPKDYLPVVSRILSVRCRQTCPAPCYQLANPLGRLLSSSLIMYYDDFSPSSLLVYFQDFMTVDVSAMLYRDKFAAPKIAFRLTRRKCPLLKFM